MTWTDEQMAEARTKYMGKLVRRPGIMPVIGIVTRVLRYHEWRGVRGSHDNDMRPLIEVKGIQETSPVVYWLDQNTWEVHDATTQ